MEVNCRVKRKVVIKNRFRWEPREHHPEEQGNSQQGNVHFLKEDLLRRQKSKRLAAMRNENEDSGKKLIKLGCFSTPNQHNYKSKVDDGCNRNVWFKPATAATLLPSNDILPTNL